MSDDSIVFRPIGVIRSEHVLPQETPIQPVYARDCYGRVELLRRKDNVLHLAGADILDGTPLLDIKPFTAKFDGVTPTRNGWQDEVDEETAEVRGMRSFRGRKPA